MKNKIIKAIDKGLLNVLSTDIADHDIDFGNSDINSEYMPEVTLEELTDMFNEDNESIFDKKMNTKNAVSLILPNDIEISLCEYEKTMNPVFLKISNDELNRTGNEILICIPNGHYISENEMPWSFDTEEIQDTRYLINSDIYGDDFKNIAGYDYDGYRTCKRIIENKGSNKVYAVEYCMGKEVNGHKGYLPSMGQLRIMCECNAMMNYIFKKLHADCTDMTFMNLWSATEKSEWDAWFACYRVVSYQYKSC